MRKKRAGNKNRARFLTQTDSVPMTEWGATVPMTFPKASSSDLRERAVAGSSTYLRMSRSTLGRNPVSARLEARWGYEDAQVARFS